VSFLNNLENLADQFLGNSDTTRQQTADAASAHVASMDPSALADHLTQSLGTLDQGSIANLGSQLLQTFANHPASTTDAAGAAQAAGVSQDAVAAGEPGAVAQLIAYAKSNPQVLQSAASDFMQGNPGAITQLAPGLFQGILARIESGGATS
jgi:hypothetical protein